MIATPTSENPSALADLQRARRDLFVATIARGALERIAEPVRTEMELAELRIADARRRIVELESSATSEPSNGAAVATAATPAEQGG